MHLCENEWIIFQFIRIFFKQWFIISFSAFVHVPQTTTTHEKGPDTTGRIGCWYNHANRPAVSPTRIELKNMEQYLTPIDPFPVRTSAFMHKTTQGTTQERSSNESTTTELPQTPRGTSEEGGSRIKTRRMKLNTRRRMKPNKNGINKKWNKWKNWKQIK